MIWVVTLLKNETFGRYSIYVFMGLFRSQEEASAFVDEKEIFKEKGNHGAYIFKTGIEVRPEKMTLFVAKHYRPFDDIFLYKGVFEDYETALREVGGIRSCVVPYEV